MRRWLPAPLLSALLFALWLLLDQSPTAGTLLLGVAIALAVPILSAPLRPLPVRVRRPRVVVGLVATVLRDVVKSNLAVAVGVVRARRHPLRPAFVAIPLDVRDANALAALAVITTIVPGTIWCELARDRGTLLLHIFDLDDEAAYVAYYKARYERPLMEIFE